MTNEKRFSPTYYTRLTSNEWKELSEEVKAKAGYRCQNCFQSKPLQIHHRHYRTLGQESIDDLMAVCADCHPIMDSLRKSGLAQVKERDERIYSARISEDARRRKWCKCPYGECGGTGTDLSHPMDTQFQYVCDQCGGLWWDYRGELIYVVDGQEVKRPRGSDE